MDPVMLNCTKRSGAPYLQAEKNWELLGEPCNLDFSKQAILGTFDGLCQEIDSFGELSARKIGNLGTLCFEFGGAPLP